MAESFREVRERFRRAERRGWFFPRAGSIKYPLSVTGVSLEDHPTRTENGERKYREAAVLFLIGREAQSRNLQVLITKRSLNVGSHPGEYCLPGGMYDSELDKDLVDTALRETKEEVGIDSRYVETVCVLPPYLSGWLHTTTVSPVVALLHLGTEELEIHENHEVESTLWVPLRNFIIGDYHTQLHGPWRGLPSSISSFHLTDPANSLPCNIWGLTAAICTGVSCIALGELPHYPSYCEAISKIDEKHVHTKELAPTSALANILLTSRLH